MPTPPTALTALPQSFLGNAPTITTSTLGRAVVGQPYSADIAATGGTPPYTWAVEEGLLPPGLTLSSKTTQSAVIQGTPTTTGFFAFVILCTDSYLQQTRVPAQMAA